MLCVLRACRGRWSACFNCTVLSRQVLDAPLWSKVGWQQESKHPSAIDQQDGVTSIPATKLVMVRLPCPGLSGAQRLALLCL